MEKIAVIVSSQDVWVKFAQGYVPKLDPKNPPAQVMVGNAQLHLRVLSPNDLRSTVFNKVLLLEDWKGKQDQLAKFFPNLVVNNG